MHDNDDKSSTSLFHSKENVGATHELQRNKETMSAMYNIHSLRLRSTLVRTGKVKTTSII